MKKEQTDEKADELANKLCQELPGNFSPSVWYDVGWYYNAVLKIDELNYIHVWKHEWPWRPVQETSYWVDTRVAGNQYHLHGKDVRKTICDLLLNIEQDIESRRSGFIKLYDELSCDQNHY